MDKIIIDGVDVSECLSFDDCNGHNICCYLDTREDEIPFANFCEENKDCYFKQLKRAKYYLNKIRDYELNSLDVDYAEYEQYACDTEYSPIIDFVELALGERKEDE